MSKPLKSVLFLIMLLSLSSVVFGLTINVDINDLGCVVGSGQPDPYSVVYCNIQDAIDDASSTDTINVGDGTYGENIIVDKAVTLQGAAGSNIVATGEYAIKITSDGVTVDGFNVDFTGTTTYKYAIRINSNDIRISNNNIMTTNDGSLGVWVCGSNNGCPGATGLTIKDNTITINDVSTGIYADHSNPAHSTWLIQSNVINSDGTNIELYDVNNVEVKENTLGVSGSLSLSYSSELSDVSGLTVADNTFLGNGDPYIGTVYEGIMPLIWIESDFINWDGDTSVMDVSIQGNVFDNWLNYGILIGEDPTWGLCGSNCNDVSNVNINYNDLSGSTGPAISSWISETVDAEYNWWGSADGPSEGDVEGDVDYYPWLDCYEDADCDYLDDDYCDLDLVKHDEGRCIEYVCEAETTTIYDCNNENYDYCDGTEIKYADYTCDNTECVLDSTTLIEDCDDGLSCNGQETCIDASCVAGTPVDCSAYGISGIATCYNNPDNIDYTWDYREAFTSQCTEPLGECTTGDETITHTCDIINCEAECESYLDCPNECVGDVYHYSGTCLGDCTCDYLTENCDLQDGWYCTDTSREFRDYYCTLSGCDYDATNTESCDDGNECTADTCTGEPGSATCQNIPVTDGTPCDDTFFCTVDDQCVSGVCSSETERDCDDALTCTLDSCDETHNECDNDLLPDKCLINGVCYDDGDLNLDNECQECISSISTSSWSDDDTNTCDDGLFCTVDDYCSVGECKGYPRDCSAYDLTEIATCDNDPDNNPLTWDYAAGFMSDCDDDLDVCTEGSYSYTHSCDIIMCGAECEEALDCLNYCSNGIRYYDGLCLGDCTCEYLSEDCDLQDGWEDTGKTRWTNIDECNEKEEKEQEYHDYSCEVEGCDYEVTEFRWQDTGNTRFEVESTSCEADGNLCTIDHCDGAGSCVHLLDVECPEPGVCEDDVVCIPITGECEVVYSELSTLCDADEDICTVDHCDGLGSCIYLHELDCSDGNECTQDLCDSTEGCYNPPEPYGTECGEWRDCPEDACFGFFAEFYPDDGNDYCDGAGSCVEYSCVLEDSYCTDDDVNDGINELVCGAECDEDIDCEDVCVGDVRFYDGICDLEYSCNCYWSSWEDCDLLDDWYDTTNTQWIDDGECTEKEQKEQEYRDYTCSDVDGVACTYIVTETRWINTTKTRNKLDGTVCDDGLFCNIGETCQEGVCTGGSAYDCSFLDDQCNVGVCNEATDQCEQDPTPNEGLPCDDGLFCNIGETCQSGVCAGGSARDCLDGIGCTDDSCDDVNDKCVNTPNDGLCPLDTICADHYCDAISDCQVIYEPDTTICRVSAGDCDVEEYCTGSSDDCPLDEVRPDIYECRASAGICDIEEYCDGVNVDCPVNEFLPDTTECRASTGDCDPEEYCTGNSANCPEDAYETLGIDCGVCAECDGLGDCVYDETQDSDCPYTMCPDACDLSPDDNPFTWDYADDVPNECLDIFTCSNYDCSYSYECSVDLCAAECDETNLCADNECEETYYDYCDDKKLVEYDNDKIKDFTTVTDSCENTCSEDCTCTDCEPDCSAPETNTYCVESVCGAECEIDDDCINKCEGDTYYYNGACQEECDCSYDTEDCDDYTDWYDTGNTQWVDDEECTEKEQKEQEYRDYGCGDEGCEYLITNTRWKDTGNKRNKTDGTPCSDTFYCTVGDECLAGICEGIPDNNLCDVGEICDPLTYLPPSGCGKFGLTLTSPEDEAYDERRVLVEVSADVMVDEMEYSLDGGRFRRLCRDCMNYSRYRSFRDGAHNLTVNASVGDETGSQTVDFFVDTREPRIIRTLPEDEEIVSGTTFTIRYTEDNLVKILLYWKRSTEEDYNEEELAGCLPGRSMECSIGIDLSAYDGEDINYYFEVYDPANIVQSEVRTITIDNTDPGVTINSPKEGVAYPERRILLNVSVDETVETLEYSLDGERFRRLCRDCDSYERTRSFSEGFNTLTIRATDEAGNEGYAVVNFIVDAREPRIRKIEPKDESYVTGSDFTVYYDEDSVREVSLFYGVEGLMDEYPMDYCPSGRRQECTATINLAGYDGQEIQYYFVVRSYLYEDTSDTYSVSVDNTDPVVTINSPEPTTYYNRRILLDIDLDLEVEILEMSLNGGRFRRLCRRCDSYSRRRSFEWGENILDIRATDYAGNIGTDSVTFTVEKLD